PQLILSSLQPLAPQLPFALPLGTRQPRSGKDKPGLLRGRPQSSEDTVQIDQRRGKTSRLDLADLALRHGTAPGQPLSRKTGSPAQLTQHLPQLSRGRREVIRF